MTDSRAAAGTPAQGQPAPAPALDLAPAPAPAPELYPQYCFHLSPTINKWCHLRAADIVALSSHPGFQGQDLYFHLNHPIKWVRVCGIVVAIDVYGDPSSTRRGQVQVVTIDDSSGETVECVIPLPSPSSVAGPSARPLGQYGQQQHREPQPQQPARSLPLIDSEIDIGHTLDIKGSLRTFRDQRQLKVEKIVHLKTTEQEVQFWERVVQLRREVLDKPWKLEEKVARRLRREAMGVDSERDLKKKKEKEREKQKEEVRRERKRRRRLEEESRKLGDERGVEEMEMEREAKRMRRLDEEQIRRSEEEEKKVVAATPDSYLAKTQAQLELVIPTRAKRNITGLERKTVSRAPMPIPPRPPRPKEPTGLERKTRSASNDSRVIPVTGKYTALGL